MPSPQERWECPSCGTPLNIAALGIYAKVACPACGHIDHVHSILANYRIESVLGLGGMSVVLRARDLILERPLAIKLLNEFYRDQPERMERFEQECELMAKVRHENVVSFYSAGWFKGQFYIAMELIHGRNLEELVREQGPMEPMRALDILSQVVEGLQAASKAGLLHRDMKPANILICEDGLAKVLDFGLSHGKMDAETEEIIWATPFYVPPETLMREPEDTRTDIYALGMTLRHLLTGQENFNPPATDIEQMLANKKALPPMAEVMPQLPEPYRDLIDRMTAYDPANRSESYTSLKLEIAEVRAALEAEKRGISVDERLRRAVPLLTGLSTTFVLGAGAAALTGYLATPDPVTMYLTPPATVEWRELDTLSAAMNSLESGDFHGAYQQFAQLAESEHGEPTVCVWASLHRRLLGFFMDKAAHDRLVVYLENSPSSAGQPLFEQMSKMLYHQEAPQDKFLQAFHTLRLMGDKLDTCHDQEVFDHLKEVRKHLREAGKPYARLPELIGEYEGRIKSSLPERARRRYGNSLAELNIAEARRVMNMLESSAGDEGTRKRLAVQKEALAIMEEAVEMMKRRSLMPAQGKRVVEENQWKELLEPLYEFSLPAELATVMLVALGDFDKAAAQNPYAKSPESPEPFAVMMRDWLARAKG